jgi:type I restriction enzyme S subunit
MKYELSKVVRFNPIERLPKGTVAKKVPMDKVQAFCRDISGFELKPYNGGAKFRNGDTIMARITPCLENGKSAYISFLDDDEVGYGSTEFIVWRAKDGVTDSKYIYYLSQCPKIKEVAIKSMVGSSGRQRVQQRVLDAHEINLPPLPEQKRIAAILSALDDKIANNKAINQRLEQVAQAIFKSWFVDFEPWGGVMPEGWRECLLEELCSLISKGITPKYDENSKQIVVNQKCIRNHDINFSLARTHNPKLINEKWLRFGDILINSTGEGTLGRVAQYLQRMNNVVVDSHITIVRPKSEKLISYLGQWCLARESLFSSMSSGSTGQTDLPRERLKRLEVIVPEDSTLQEYSNIAAHLMEKRIACIKESLQLATIRDTLLPRLMSGEITTETGGLPSAPTAW